MKKAVGILSAVLLTCSLFLTGVFSVGAEAAITRTWVDSEGYSETADTLFNWVVAKRNKAVTLALNTKSVLNGKNCMVASWNTSNNPGYGSFFYEPADDDKAFKNLTTNADGLKVTLAADAKVIVRMRLSFDWSDYENDLWLTADQTPRTYTIRWTDKWDAEMQAEMAKAESLCRWEFVIFGSVDTKDTGNYDYNPVSGNLYIDDLCFFKGSDATDLTGTPTGAASLGTTAPVPSTQTTTTTTKQTTQTTVTERPTQVISTAGSHTSTTQNIGGVSADNPEESLAFSDSEVSESDASQSEETVTTASQTTAADVSHAETDAAGSSGSLWWLWVLVGVVAVAGGAVLVVLLLKKKTGVAESRQEKDDSNQP